MIELYYSAWVLCYLQYMLIVVVELVSEYCLICCVLRRRRSGCLVVPVCVFGVYGVCVWRIWCVCWCIGCVLLVYMVLVVGVYGV